MKQKGLWVAIVLMVVLSACNKPKREIEQAITQIETVDSLLIGHPDQAYILLKKLYKHQEDLSDSARIELYWGFSDYYFQRNKLDSSLVFLNQAQRLAQEQEDTSRLLDTHIRKGNMHLENRSIVKAIQAFQYGDQFPQEEKWMQYLLRMQIGKAICLYDLGDFHAANQMLKPVLKKSIELKDKKLEQACIWQLARLNRTAEDYPTAIYWLNRVLNSRDRGMGKLLIADVWHDLGVCYRQVGKLDSSRYAYGQAFGIYFNAGNRMGMLRVNFNKLNLLMDEGRMSEAEKLFIDVKSIAKKLGIPQSDPYMLGMEAEFMWKNKHYPKAIQLNDSVFKLNPELHPEVRLSLMKQREEIYEAAEDFEKAYKENKRISSLRDSIKKVGQAEIDSQKTLVINSDLKQSQSVLDKAKLDNKKSTTLCKVFVIISTLLWVIAFVFAWLNRQKITRHLRQRRDLLIGIYQRHPELSLPENYRDKTALSKSGLGEEKAIWLKEKMMRENWYKRAGFDSDQLGKQLGLSIEQARNFCIWAFGLEVEDVIRFFRVQNVIHLLKEEGESAELFAKVGFTSEKEMKRSFVKISGIQYKDWLNLLKLGGHMPFLKA